MSAPASSSCRKLPAFRLQRGDEVMVNRLRCRVTHIAPLASFLTRAQEAAGMKRPERLRLTLRPVNGRRGLRSADVDQYELIRCYNR